MGHQSEHVALALRELLEPLALVRRRVLFGEILGEHARRRRPHVHVAVRNRAHRVHELAVRRALHEVAGRAGFHKGHQVVLFGVHREHEHA